MGTARVCWHNWACSRWRRCTTRGITPVTRKTQTQKSIRSWKKSKQQTEACWAFFVFVQPLLFVCLSWLVWSCCFCHTCTFPVVHALIFVVHMLLFMWYMCCYFWASCVVICVMCILLFLRYMLWYMYCYCCDTCSVTSVVHVVHAVLLLWYMWYTQCYCCGTCGTYSVTAVVHVVHTV